MKVLFVPNYRISERRGVYSEGLSAAGPEGRTTYWFLKYFPEAEVEIIDNASPFPWNRIADILGFEVFQAFRALMRQSSADVILSHSFNSGLTFALLRSLLKVRKPPHFVVDIGSLNGGVENPIEIAAIRLALRSVSGLVYHSRVNERFYRRHFSGVPREFVHFGTEPQFFEPLGHPPSGDYVLSIGTGRRDYDTLLKAWRHIDFPLKIVGRTDIDLQGLNNVVTMPKVSVDELRSLIHNCAFVVLPVEDVRYSAGQMTLLECMSMAKPIIASRSFGIIDYLRDEVNCLTYECGNEADLRAKADRLMQDPALAMRLGLEARREVVESLNEECMGKAIYRFISANSGHSFPDIERAAGRKC